MAEEDVREATVEQKVEMLLNLAEAHQRAIDDLREQIERLEHYAVMRPER